MDSFILFGGGASLSGIIEFLSKELAIEVKLGDVLEGLNLDAGAVADKGKISYRLGLAVGAALTEGKGINLLPPEIKEETKRTIKRGTLEGIATAIILILALTYIGMRIQLNNFQKRISVAGLELSSLQDQLKKAEEEILANKILSDEPQWEDIFKEVSNIIPDTIYITNFKMDNNIITMKGVVGAEGGEGILADFILTLEKGIFDNVKLVESKSLGEKTGIEFELKCWIDYEN